ncbi:MAG: hypothetical protein HC866_11950 [Leptolyngbyaceae cyanobacterium RU_5_1]|nr:hypothetical protein [Leptolyngbyaceae cyanobacterium RU_5_1]
MGKRTWLENLINNSYLPAIAKLRDTPEDRKDAEHWADWMKRQWEEHGLKTLKQQQSLMDRTRRAIKDRLGEDHFALESMRFTTEEYVQINNEKQGVVSQRNEQVQFLDNPDAIVAQAVRLLNSPEWSEIAAGLSVLTGRRSSEILSTAEFVPKTKWSVTFTGALKRRGETQILSFEIPTLTTAEKVCKALEKVRRELPEALGLSPQAVNSKYGQAVARACDRHFAELVPVREGKDNLYTHLFRSVYATIATFWYCPPRVNETEFRAYIQGHFAVLDEHNPELRRSLAASRHYSDYEIADQVIENYGGKRKGIKLGVGGVEMIEAFKVDEVVELLEELPPKPGRRQTTSVRLWQDDKAGLNQVFQHLELDEDLSQQDKMAYLLKWISERLEMPYPKRVEALQEEDQQEPPRMDNALPVEEVEELKNALPIEKHEEAQIESDPEVQETVISTGLEAKIDKLVDVMTQFIQVQMRSGPVPQSVVPKPVTSSIAQAQEQEAPNTTSQEQPERRRRRSNETDEIIHQAIRAIMQYNDQAARYDDKWAITINALKAFAKSQRKIEMILQDRKEEIKHHHDKHQIDPERHNLKHRGKHKIEETIRL